jgi:hypothetical protein
VVLYCCYCYYQLLLTVSHCITASVLSLPLRYYTLRLLIAACFNNNTELCTDVPGSACPSAATNARVAAGAEGFIHVHRGLRGKHYLLVFSCCLLYLCVRTASTAAVHVFVVVMQLLVFTCFYVLLRVLLQT